MGTNLLRASAAVAFLLLASVAVAFAGSSGEKRSSRSDDRKSVVLHLTGTGPDEIYVDHNEPDFGVADELVFTNNLLRDGKTVGEDGGVCTVTRVADDDTSTFYCTGDNALPGGQITTSGLVSYGPTEEVKEEPYFFAITGGTGKYRNARGEVRIKELTANEFRLTFRIIL